MLAQDAQGLRAISRKGAKAQRCGGREESALDVPVAVRTQDSELKIQGLQARGSNS
jgi:hypothetical protein